MTATLSTIAVNQSFKKERRHQIRQNATHVRLLLVEDCPDDAWLLVRQLQKAGLSVTYQLVCCAESMQQALEREPFDLVISDYCLPTFSGLGALQLLHDSGLDLPFILVSGAVSEEAAEEAMAAGADDFLEKGRYSRLVPAIQRELRDAADRKARRAAEAVADQAWQQAPWDVPVGSNIDGYRVESRLGEGVSAVVYRVVSPRGETLALKLLKSGEEIRPRWKREMSALLSLRHDNIPYLADFGEFRGLPYLCMEWVQGRPLSASLGSLTLAQCLSYLKQLVQVLDYAHQQGILHRDLKPGNVLITPSGQVKLSDFGLARAQDSTLLTAEGTLMGTPAYTAPEIFSGAAASAASDLYSLGCMAFEMLTGRTPFRGDSPLALAVQHIHQPAPDLGELCPECPPSVAAGIQQLLCKTPQQRRTLSDLA